MPSIQAAVEATTKAQTATELRTLALIKESEEAATRTAEQTARATKASIAQVEQSAAIAAQAAEEQMGIAMERANVQLMKMKKECDDRVADLTRENGSLEEQNKMLRERVEKYRKENEARALEEDESADTMVRHMSDFCEDIPFCYANFTFKYIARYIPPCVLQCIPKFV